MTIASINPTTGETLRVFDEMSPAALDAALSKSTAAWHDQRRRSFSQRAGWMLAAADLLEQNQQDYAAVLTLEMGKTLGSAVAEVKKCASACRYYAEHAEAFLADEVLASDAARSFVRHLPLGPTLAVMPWNFPFWQVFRFAAPALMAGNVALLKHASNVPQSALLIEHILLEAGFPEGCLQTLLLGSDKIADVVADARVSAVTLTGSEGAGRAVAAAAGKAIKPSLLELGGSDPFLVMPSADLDAAVTAAVTGRTQNNGQSCIAAKRFIVHTDVYEPFREQFVARFQALTVGDPMADATDIGPLATAQGRRDLAEQVERSVAAGARRLTGARPIDGAGFFYQPGILENIPAAAPAYAEEVFGPVAMLFRADTLEDAMAIGNATRFGLGSVIFSNDADEINQAIDQLEAGATFVNAIVASDPRLPFGGIKASGYGRELARDGILEFVNRKTVSIARGRAQRHAGSLGIERVVLAPALVAQQVAGFAAKQRLQPPPAAEVHLALQQNILLLAAAFNQVVAADGGVLEVIHQVKK
ncbi:MAG: NAD-dependent succinate-semialdehyde dehydrogenase, partial [Gammaproteobacteria bacterium]|nr:NAD-dependent succinate-semialdehyde dehydrogenase [Gammaproteobacteria bacterium]